MDYEKELKVMENLTKEEYLASLRRCVHAAAAPRPGGAKKKNRFFFRTETVTVRNSERSLS
jgi:hypothetical protein